MEDDESSKEYERDVLDIMNAPDANLSEIVSAIQGGKVVMPSIGQFYNLDTPNFLGGSNDTKRAKALLKLKNLKRN